MTDINDIASPPASNPAPGMAAPPHPPQAYKGPAVGVNGKAKVPIRLSPTLIKELSKSVPTVNPAVIAAWHEAAHRLASWASEHLVNTLKGCGGYWVDECCTVSQTTHKEPPDLDRLVRHFRARTSNDLVGLHALVLGGDGGCRSRWTGVDIDRHDDEVDAAANLALALAVHDRAKAAGFEPLLSQSDGKGGYHCLVLHAEPIEARLARAFGLWLVHDRESLGVVGEPEVFPKQEKVGPGGWGNWLRVFGHHHKWANDSRFMGRVDMARRPGRDRLHPRRHGQLGRPDPDRGPGHARGGGGGQAGGGHLRPGRPRPRRAGSVNRLGIATG